MERQPDDRARSRPKEWRDRARRLRPFLHNAGLVGLGIAFALVALLLFSVIDPGPPRLTKSDVDKEVASAMASATPPPPDAVRVFQAIAPSLVQIDTRFLNDKGVMESGSGAGVVLNQNGTILTALHVVKGALDLKVVFADGAQSAAALTASEPEKDIAVVTALQPPPGLVPATLGDPRFVQVGDEAIVVGDPFGLTDSLTVGAISGLDRSFLPPNTTTPMTGLIQFDAAVNPGNSGGPLLDRNGDVIGVVTGLVNPTGQDVFIGIGFAVPIDVAASAAGTPPY